MTADTSPFLLLLSPSVVQKPELAGKVLAEFNSASVFHHQVLDRVSEKAIQLEPSFYNRVHLATDGSKLALDENTLTLLFASMAPNASLSGVDVSDPLPALMAGFVKKDDGSLHKPAPASTATVSLKRPTTSGTTTTTRPVPLPFKRLAKLTINEDEDDEDDLIDENELVDGDLTPAIQIPEKCQPANGKKRRRACKDCTCGLKELEQQELEAQQAKQNNVVQLAVDDTAEIDFTVAGKTTGSCGSCALGDAFRCDGCPYLGLPPFKPGQVVSIDALGGDDF